MDIEQILQNTKTIAIVGLSTNPAKASHGVAQYLMQRYHVIPVNPQYSTVLGLPCYPDLPSISDAVDMVVVFRPGESVLPFVLPSIALGVTCFWMQLGIENPVARSQLQVAGIMVIENRCTKVEHARYF